MLGADGGRVLGRPGLPSAGLPARRRRPRTADPDGPPRDPHSRRPARSPWPLRATRRSIRARRATSSERRARAGEDHRFVEYGPRRRCGRARWVPRLAAAVCGVCTSRTWAPECARSHRLEGAFKQLLESRCRRPGTFFGALPPVCPLGPPYQTTRSRLVLRSVASPLSAEMDARLTARNTL